MEAIHDSEEVEHDSEHFLHNYTTNPTPMVKLRIVYLFFILLFPTITKSQSDASQQSKDAVLQKINEYHKSGNKIEEAKSWENLAKQVSEKDTSATGKIKSFEKALTLYEALNNKEKQVDLLYQIVRLQMRLGENDKAEINLMNLLHLQQSMGIQKRYGTYDFLTIVNRSKGNLNKALFYALEAIKNVEALGDTSATNVYSRLAMIYRDLGQVEKSIPLFRKVLEQQKKKNVPDTNYIFNIYNTTASLVNAMLLIGQAQEALDLTGETIKSYPLASEWEKGIASKTLGDCYNALAQYERAAQYYLEAVAWEEKKPHGFGYRFKLYYDVGKFYSERKQYNKAKGYLKEALATRGSFSLTMRQDIYLLLFRADSAAGNYLQAIRYFQVHKALNDSIYNEAKSRQIEELQIQYETAQKEKDIKLLQNESALQKSQLQQANLAKNLTFSGGGLMFIILALLYNSFRLKQRNNRQLEIQQIEINQTNRSLQNLLEEKEWLLREIHHRVKNNLQIVMSLLNTQSAYLESGAALTAIRDSQHRIHSISLIHEKLYQSKNVALIDISTYIQELVEYLQDSFDTGYRIHFEVDIEPIELDVTQAVPLGLILNEAISNAIKYAFPNHKGLISISMHKTDDAHFLLTIADDGVGLPKDFNLEKSNTLGLNLMKGLSKQLGGSFELKNENGLTIHILFVEEQIIKSDLKLPEAAVFM